MGTDSLWAGRSAVSPSSPAAAQKGEQRREGSGFDSARVELKWGVEKLVGWSDGAMQGRGGWSARARSRRPWRSGGRRKKEKKPRNGGALGVFIGQRAPGRVEWRLGKADSARGGSTAGWRSERAALRMAGRRVGSGERLGHVRAGEGAKGQARWRWRAPRVNLAADAPWMRSTGGVRQAAGETEQAGRREMEIRAYL